MSGNINHLETLMAAAPHKSTALPSSTLGSGCRMIGFDVAPRPFRWLERRTLWQDRLPRVSLRFARQSRRDRLSQMRLVAHWVGNRSRFASFFRVNSRLKRANSRRSNLCSRGNQRGQRKTAARPSQERSLQLFMCWFHWSMDVRRHDNGVMKLTRVKSSHAARTASIFADPTTATFALWLHRQDLLTLSGVVLLRAATLPQGSRLHPPVLGSSAVPVRHQSRAIVSSSGRRCDVEMLARELKAPLPFRVA